MNQAWLTKLSKLVDSKIPFVVSTITKFLGSSPRKVEAKMITYIDHEGCHIFDTIGGGKLEQQVIEDATELINSKGESYSKVYKLDESNDMACGGSVEVFHELTAKRSDLYIFGAGHVGQALSRVLENGPFTIHLIDEREEWALSKKASAHAIRHHQEWDDFTKEAAWDSESVYVAVMTHDHKYDVAVLGDVLKRECKFVGVLGSSHKWEIAKGKLREAGVTEDRIAKVACPFGEKNLGKGPTEIAIGIARQLLRSYENIEE